MKKRFEDSKGFILVQTLVFASIALVLMGAIVSWVGNTFRATKTLSEREQAFYIAEAGIEYYRWHLAHAQQDFKDGRATSSPSYVHSYKDTSGNVIGSFALQIIPPKTGSTLVTVIASGTVASSSVAARAIESKLAIPSFAKFSFVANTPMRFGEGTEIFGDMHSNDGIRFDGVTHGLVTSAKASYDDPDHSGAVEFGVHTHVNPPPATGSNDSFRPLEAPPSTPAERRDVFMVGRQFPVPAVDFNGLITTLASLKTKAQASSRYFGSSGASGYLLRLKTDDTFELRRVNSLINSSNNCTNNSISNVSGWGTWSVNSSTLINTYTFPADGVLFFEDNLWVEGTISSARLTIASGRFPENSSTQTSITVNNNLKYTYYDGTDVIALIAQNNINIGLNSLNSLRVDAALLAKNGRVGRYHYASQCGSNYKRSDITVYGTIGSNQRYGFAYTDDTGYTDRTIIYDGNLLYGPPPSFPLAGDQYSTISWREL